eukprot:gb/GECG01015901.1/.p1 GENE.gb/GECG01015901.1/~~gb/GECG01015901.1/.p1  ORF type:complete len:746 (+),score=88.37 gb/GECG01015901.1/:1-2238(+)
MDPMGHFHAWGFTPSLDLIELYRATWALKTQRKGTESIDTAKQEDRDAEKEKEETKKHGAKRPLNVLLMQVGDIRHVLKTIAQKGRHRTLHISDDEDDLTDRPIHFYVYDKPIENIARHMLLMSIALDWSIPLKRRVVAWLETYGNTLVPERTSKYVARQRMRLVDFITSIGNDEDDEKNAPSMGGSTNALNERRMDQQRQRRHAVQILKQVIDVSYLRYRERDELEKQFLSWSHDSECRVEKYREQRLRNHFGTRFDFRNNLIDWDYHMDILPYAGVIHAQHYRQWRNTGVAFEFGDATYTNANRSLTSYVEGKERGKSALRRGFWGDIICSPYHAVGTSAFTGDKTYLGTSKTQKEKIDNTRRKAQEEYASGNFQTKTSAHDGYIGDDSVREIFGIGPEEPVRQYPHFKEGISSQKAMECVRGLFEIVHRHAGSEQYRHNSMEIATYNILSWMFEIESGFAYGMQEQHELYSGLGSAEATAAPPEQLSGSDHLVHEYLEHQALQRTRSIGNRLGAFQVIPFTGDFAQLLEKIEQCRTSSLQPETAAACNDETREENITARNHPFYQFFDVVVVGGRAARYFDLDTESSVSSVHANAPDFTNILAPRATVIAETARNVLSMKRESRKSFEQNIISLALRKGLRLIGTDRVLSGDTFSVGSVTETTPEQSRPATDHINKYGEHSAAMKYVLSEILRHNARSGDNPPGEHLVFEWDVHTASSRKRDYSRVQSALYEAPSSREPDQS